MAKEDPHDYEASTVEELAQRAEKPIRQKGHVRNSLMNDPEDKIHVIPLGEDWEIEAQSGIPLAHETKKQEAISVACDLAREEGVSTVIVHDGDGVTEALHPGEVSNKTSSEKSKTRQAS